MACPCTVPPALGEASLMPSTVALTDSTASGLTSQLLREDGQEDVCFVTWRPSTGKTRLTAILHQALLPIPGERKVHGNASFEAEYVLRAAHAAALNGMGIAFAHSHPLGRGWQPLNHTDQIAEARIANLAKELTGIPLVGLTLAGDGSWSGRIWEGSGREVRPNPCDRVRVVGDSLAVSFNGTLKPVPPAQASQIRTVHTWGEETQGKLARLRVAVAGLGSVGMAVAETLARTGIQELGVFDFDTVESVNLDRLRGARRLDAILRRPKTHVARRLLREASTAEAPSHSDYELSICEPDGLARLLDFDIIFSCVDRPWPRHVLNTLAYADLIPVIEGGMVAFQNSNGTLRNAYWRSTVVRPGRPCLACLGQYIRSDVELERDGSFDDPSYIANLPEDAPILRRENVAAFSASVTAALMQQFISYVACPGGIGDPGPLRYSARDHSVEREAVECTAGCPFPGSIGCGDARPDPTSRHLIAEGARLERASPSLLVRAGRAIDDALMGISSHFEGALWRAGTSP